MTARPNVHSSSTTAVNNSLRPRNRRLISGLDDDEDDPYFVAENAANTRLKSPLDRSPGGHRPISPIPVPRLPRPSSRDITRSDTTRRNIRGNGIGSISPKQTSKKSSVPSSSLWGASWKTLQGIASNLLGADDDQERELETRQREGYKIGQANHTRSVSTTGYWGPTIQPTTLSAGDIGKGTREEQLSALRARKRRDLLTRQEPSYIDTLGKFKRRLSDDIDSQPNEVDGAESDALVYVHQVKKDDTLAGLSIRYHCSVANLRKANRMWPNDTVQMRERILLPVDACAVKGTLIHSPQDPDLLASESEALSAGQAEEIPQKKISSSVTNGLNNIDHSPLHRPAPSFSTSSADGDGAWKHDAWVLLPDCVAPTQIVRVSRKAIGYFPPARRKSIPYTDTGTPSSSSLELSRTAMNSTTNRMPTSPLRKDTVRGEIGRPRGSSNVGNGYFPAYLTGPGGVGTMDKDVKMPGPGPDSLNQMFAKHLPDVAPPRSQHALLTPELPLFSDDPPDPASGGLTPGTGKNLNLENVGGAIETWMRRVAAKTQISFPSGRPKLARVSVGSPSQGVGGVGDLIEMTGDFEIGRDGEFDEGHSHMAQEGGQVVRLGMGGSGTSYHEAVTKRERGGNMRSNKKD